ncbi:SDR family NAD(P)-dependent oxidoreductase [Mangrovicella endophytica]|uniref:SDR family NAD(P)-dependent oxidoreductase n=1 Tax=Mangrovicella endophytica TaxID=2066697 RepID=UPI000C9DB255|nr:glucose 1-dehydrogenase [Mangrovicella endophytica]
MSAAGTSEGKVVLVTGGSRGIGAGIVRRFAADGHRVVVVYRSDRDAAERLAGELSDGSGRCIAVQADIADAAAVDRLVATTVETFGGLDVVVNCAGVGTYRKLGEMDTAYVRAIFDANVLGTVLVTQAALPHLPSPGGRIINVASALAFRPIPSSTVYSASKAAVVTLTHGFAKELGGRGITVNAVAPGVIETDMTRTILQERGEQILSMTPLGRIGQPDDIAGIVAFLASAEAGWITGRTIVADGGVT